MYTVTFTFEQEGIAPVVLKDVEPGASLLELALENDISLHHNCGGVCACSSCHSYVIKGAEHLEEKSEREKDFLEVAVNPRPESRLSCQSILLEGEGNIGVIIPDQRLVPDE
ncbi:MAG: 2Fe-2S iron-sulfur cluster binding domain-containing protein [Chitinophagaceae bacterium]|jgi:2Fe-2S ferredoxin|nr:2Fe-2S iron-sulfur cluster binding domain-containing protein [Chitinophagaceae bacterium]OQY95357.1 MAG: ferredoxin [Sphingobacteriales bacterium UTBCD1]